MPDDELEWLVVFCPAGVIMADIGTRDGGGTDGLCSILVAAIGMFVGAGKAVGTWILGPYAISPLILAPAAAASALA